MMPKPSAVGSMLARCSPKLEHHALGPRAGAGGEQDHRVVVRPRRGLRVARRRARDLGEECFGGGLPQASQPQPRRRHGGEQIVELEPVLVEHQLRLEAREDIVELVAVHLDMHGADGRPIGHHAEIAGEMLDRIVGQQRHPVVAARCRARAGAVAIRRVRSCNCAVADRAPVVGRHDPRLGRIAARRPADPVSQRLRARAFLHGRSSSEILSIISISAGRHANRDAVNDVLTDARAGASV